MTGGLSTSPAKSFYRLFNFGIFEKVACVASGIVIYREQSFGRGTAEPCGEWGGDEASPPILTRAKPILPAKQAIEKDSA